MVFSQIFRGRRRQRPFEKLHQLNSISAAVEARGKCARGGIKRMRLHLIFFEVALAIKCGSR